MGFSSRQRALRFSSGFRSEPLNPQSFHDFFPSPPMAAGTLFLVGTQLATLVS
jgi:hypothetical protein